MENTNKKQRYRVHIQNNKYKNVKLYEMSDKKEQN